MSFLNESSEVEQRISLRNAQLWRQNGAPCEMELITDMDGQQSPCQSALLTICSKFLKAMLESMETSTKHAAKQQHQQVITLSDNSGEQLKPLLCYCYKGEIEATAWMELLQTPALLRFVSVFGAYVEMLAKQIRPSNCFVTLQLAERLKLAELSDVAVKHIRKYFVQLCNHHEFLQMSGKQLTHLITSDELNAPTEKFVFESIMFWVRHDTLKRSAYIPELLGRVQLLSCSPAAIKKAPERPVRLQHHSLLMTEPYSNRAKRRRVLVKKWSLLVLFFEPSGPDVYQGSSDSDNNSEYDSENDSVYESDSDNDSNGDSATTIANASDNVNVNASTSNSTSTSTSTIANVSTIANASTSNSTTTSTSTSANVSTSNSTTTSTSTSANVSTSANANASTSANANVNVSANASTSISFIDSSIEEDGGLDYDLVGTGGMLQFKIVKYEPSSKRWSTFGIYAGKRCSVVHSYDLQSRKITKLAKMPCKIQYFHTAVLDGFLYVVSGATAMSRLVNKVQRYDPKTNTWCQVARIPTARVDLGLDALDGLLYAFGGSDKYDACVSVTECYDPRTDTWTELASMNLGRCLHGGIAARGFVYAIGGYVKKIDGEGIIISAAVERYDPRQDQWTLICSMQNAGKAIECVLMGERLLALNSSNSIIEEYDFNKDSWSYVTKHEYVDLDDEDYECQRMVAVATYF